MAGRAAAKMLRQTTKRVAIAFIMDTMLPESMENRLFSRRLSKRNVRKVAGRIKACGLYFFEHESMKKFSTCELQAIQST